MLDVKRERAAVGPGGAAAGVMGLPLVRPARTPLAGARLDVHHLPHGGPAHMPADGLGALRLGGEPAAEAEAPVELSPPGEVATVDPARRLAPLLLGREVVGPAPVARPFLRRPPPAVGVRVLPRDS